MEDLYNVESKCRVCGSESLKVLMNLSPASVVMPNTGMRSILKNEELIPVTFAYCNNCTNLQINETVKPTILYSNFKYVTSITHGLVDHFEKFSNECFKNKEITKDDFILDIGSNDGSLLKPFKKKGCKVLGIEPAVELANKVSESGIETIADFFSFELSKKIRMNYGIPKLITCNNTFANISDLNDFTMGLSNLANKETKICIETQYGIDVLEKKLIDTIYHEHLNYFTIKSLKSIFKKNKLFINEVEHLENKGGSLRLKISRDESHQNLGKRFIAENSENINKMTQEIDKVVKECRAELDKIIQESNKKIFLFGSSVSCVSLLNQLDIKTEKIEAVIDEKPLTDNCFVRGQNIKVRNLSEIKNKKQNIILNLAYRYGDIIFSKHKKFFSENQFINMFPKIKYYN